MTRGEKQWVLKAVAILIVLLAAPGQSLRATGPDAAVHDPTYPSTSWALGIVYPEGAKLAGGGSLQWGSVSNLTSVVILPNISAPSGIVYAVMSVMAADGSVLQVAAGAYPDSSSWFAYSWAVEGASTSAPSYDWVLNSSAPAMSPGDTVRLSIYKNGTRWDLGVHDLLSGVSRESAFPPGIALALAQGDQEAFALESYSRAAADFENMGNLTLAALLADGKQVAGGTYAYSGWDPDKNPVFAVGSSGTNPPAFISLQQEAEGSYAWGYLAVWSGGTFSTGTILGVFIAIGFAGAIFAVCAAVLATRSPRPKSATKADS